MRFVKLGSPSGNQCKRCNSPEVNFSVIQCRSKLDLRSVDTIGQALLPDQLCSGTPGYYPRSLSRDLTNILAVDYIPASSIIVESEWRQKSICWNSTLNLPISLSPRRHKFEKYNGKPISSVRSPSPSKLFLPLSIKHSLICSKQFSTECLLQIT